MAQRASFARNYVGNPGPSEWSPRRRIGTDDWSAFLVCPNGHGSVIFDHDISPTGLVEPSVECSRMTCGFHAHVALQGWPPKDL